MHRNGGFPIYRDPRYKDPLILRGFFVLWKQMGTIQGVAKPLTTILASSKT